MVRNSLVLVGAFLLSVSTAYADKDPCIEGLEPTKASTSKVVYADAKIKDATTEIKIQGGKLESPVVSPDGTKLIVVGNHFKGVPATEIFIKDLAASGEGVQLKKPLLNVFVKGSFSPADVKVAAKGFTVPEGGIVACELEYRFGAITKSVIGLIKTKQWEPLGYHSVVSFFDTAGKRLGALDFADFGLPKGTFIEHPRIGPKGTPGEKFLTFYTQSSDKVQGIYLYNLETKQTKYMGNFLDKHPTWSADGKRIFYHEQGKLEGTGEEIARIGYYDLDFRGDDVALGKRVILGDPKNPIGTDYVYQKHPAYHVGLDMVFFHARNGIDGSKSIGVISLKHPEHDPIFIKLENASGANGDEYHFTHAEHVDVSDSPESPLYFVARKKFVPSKDMSAEEQAAAEKLFRDEEDKSNHLMTIPFEALKKLTKKFEE